jgi:hypothetical protein
LTRELNVAYSLKKITGKLHCHLEPSFIFLKGVGNNLNPASHKTILKIEKDGTALEITFYVSS